MIIDSEVLKFLATLSTPSVSENFAKLVQIWQQHVRNLQGPLSIKLRNLVVATCPINKLQSSLSL